MSRLRPYGHNGKYETRDQNEIITPGRDVRRQDIKRIYPLLPGRTTPELITPSVLPQGYTQPGACANPYYTGTYATAFAGKTVSIGLDSRYTITDAYTQFGNTSSDVHWTFSDPLGGSPLDSPRYGTFYKSLANGCITLDYDIQNGYPAPSGGIARSYPPEHPAVFVGFVVFVNDVGGNPVIIAHSGGANALWFDTPQPGVVQ